MNKIVDMYGRTYVVDMNDRTYFVVVEMNGRSYLQQNQNDGNKMKLHSQCVNKILHV